MRRALRREVMIILVQTGHHRPGNTSVEEKETGRNDNETFQENHKVGIYTLIVHPFQEAA